MRDPSPEAIAKRNEALAYLGLPLPGPSSTPNLEIEDVLVAVVDKLRALEARLDIAPGDSPCEPDDLP